MRPRSRHRAGQPPPGEQPGTLSFFVAGPERLPVGADPPALAALVAAASGRRNDHAPGKPFSHGAPRLRALSEIYTGMRLIRSSFPLASSPTRSERCLRSHPAGIPEPVTRHSALATPSPLRSIDERSCDPDTDPATVASEHGISRRYLHLVLAQARHELRRDTRSEARLKRAKTLLDDVRFARISIADIAWRCGFPELQPFRPPVPTAFRHRAGRLSQDIALLGADDCTHSCAIRFRLCIITK